MRVLFALALLGLAAGCAPPEEIAAPPVARAATAPPAPLALVPPPPVAVAAPAPAPLPGVIAPEPVAALYVPNPLAWLFTGIVAQPLPAGRLTLSNFNYDDARVQAVITPYTDCQEHPGAALSDFEIPLNGTRIINALPGADVCWRRALTPGPSPTTPGVEIVSGWTEWSRAFTSSGRSIDSRL